MEVSAVDISISIVTYNSRQFIGDCLRSIYCSDSKARYEVTVVDNASQDETAALIRRDFPQARLIENRENVGFARAHNQAIRFGTGRHYLILNPDTFLLPGSLDHMMDFLDRHPSVGAVAPQLYTDPDQTFVMSHAKWINPALLLYGYTVLGVLFPNNPFYRNVWAYDWHLLRDGTPRQAKGLSGSCIMVSGRCLRDVGLLDERFFLFHEDADWTLRIAQRGWKLYLLPRAEVVHYVGRSATYLEGEVDRVEWESTCKFIRKHYGFLFAKAVSLAVRLDRSLLIRSGRTAKIVAWMARRSGQTRVVRPTLVIQWPEVSGATSYLLEISTGLNFMYRAAARVRGLTWTFPKRLLDYWLQSTLYWRVRPILDGDRLGRTISHGCWQPYVS